MVLKMLKNYTSTVCFTDLDQGIEIISRFSLPKSMKHTVFLKTLFFRLKEFDDALNAEEIRLPNFRKLCFEGKNRKIETKHELN
jgi:hypothetical protein